jgi:hypothetical protein
MKQLTIVDVAERVGVSKSEMQSLIDSGDLPMAVFVANDFAALGAPPSGFSLSGSMKVGLTHVISSCLRSWWCEAQGWPFHAENAWRHRGRKR